MKAIKYLMILAIMLCFGNAYSQPQFTNNSFETWVNNTNLPQDWNTLIFSSGIQINLCDIQKTTDAQAGDFAVQLKAKKLNPFVVSMLQSTMGIEGLDKLLVPGILTNATINLNLTTIQSLLPIIEELDTFFDGDRIDFSSLTPEQMQHFSAILSNAFSVLFDGGLDLNNQIPSSVEGYYKFETLDTLDFALLTALLIKEDTLKHIVGGGFLPVSPTSEYTPFSINIARDVFGLSDDSMPDKLIFLALTGSMDTNAKEFAALKLDNLNINYSSSLDDVKNKNEIIAYPNPTTNNTFVLNIYQPEDVHIYNVLGKEVMFLPKYYGQKITILGSGIYFIKTNDKVTKLIVR